MGLHGFEFVAFVRKEPLPGEARLGEGGPETPSTQGLGFRV